MAAKVPCLASCVVASACATSKPAQAPSPPPTATTTAVSTTRPPAPKPAASPRTIASPTAPPGGKDHTPPKIVSAQIDTKGVRLHFSEPIAPTDDIDPSSFRLSVAGGEVDDGDAYAYHLDLADIAELDAPLRVVNLALDEGGRALELTFSDKLPTEFCEVIEEELSDAADSAGVEYGLFLHYAPGLGGKIEDHSGNALAAFGAAWATSRAETMETVYEGAKVGSLFDGLVRVHCGAGAEPGALAWRGVVR